MLNYEKSIILRVKNALTPTYLQTHTFSIEGVTYRVGYYILLN